MTNGTFSNESRGIFAVGTFGLVPVILYFVLPTIYSLFNKKMEMINYNEKKKKNRNNSSMYMRVLLK